MKVLVTGGSGYLGTHVRSYLNADDFSRDSGHSVLNLRDVVAVRDYDVVIHLAARLEKSPESAESVFLTNVEGTLNVLREVKPGAAFIFASTKDVYGRFADNFRLVPETCPTLYSGQSPLEWSKLIAERYVEYYAAKTGFRSCIFRISTVYAPPSDGNIPNFVGAYAEAINKGETIYLPGGGTPRRDLLHVDDLSRACQAFADSVIKNGLYNLGGGPENSLTLTGLIESMEKVSGLEAVVADDEAPDPVPLNYVSDLGLVTQELDWKPEVGVEEGLKSLFGNQ
jgi:CDP-paratose 2-epimerase